MPVAKKKVPQWITTTHSPFDFFTFSAVALSYVQEMPKVLGFTFNYKYLGQDIIYDENNFSRHEKDLIKNPGHVQKDIQYIEKQVEVLTGLSKKYGKKHSVEAFAAWYQAFIGFFPTFGLVIAPERVLKKNIFKFLSEDEFSAISFADKTATWHEQIDFLKISQLPSSSVKFKTLLKKHITKYEWLNGKMFIRNPLLLKVLLRRAKENSATAEKQILDAQTHQKNLRKNLFKVLSKLTHAQRKQVELFRKLLYLRTARAEAVCYASELTLPLFKWIGSQLGMERTELLRFSGTEIMDMLKGGRRLDPAKRTEFSAELVKKKFTVKWGSWGKPLFDGTWNGNSISGIIACRGKVKGTVAVLNDFHELGKFKKGQILVARYTNPNFVTAMEKAAGIVTDVGSLTSHAAIISREMNKPCIVDTRIASRVLKNGDLVLLDANKGVITLLTV